MNFYSHRIKESHKSVHFQIHWWGHQVGKLQHTGEITSIDFKCDNIFSFRVGGGKRSVMFYNTFQRFYLLVTKMLGQIQRLEWLLR
jgi:hypothetical protein